MKTPDEIAARFIERMKDSYQTRMGPINTEVVAERLAGEISEAISQALKEAEAREAVLVEGFLQIAQMQVDTIHLKNVRTGEVETIPVRTDAALITDDALRSASTRSKQLLDLVEAAKAVIKASGSKHVPADIWGAFEIATEPFIKKEGNS